MGVLMSLTPYMGLDKPEVSVTLGPEWASMLNALIDLIDAHDHSDGNGAQVTPAGILINAALDFVNNQIQNAKSVGLYAKLAADLTHLRSLQSVGGDAYWINGAGAAVRLTNGGSIVSTGSGVLSPSVISSYPYTVLTSDAQSVLVIDTSAARTLTLPAASNAMMVGVKDGVGSASTNNISVDPDGTDTIEGENSTYFIQEDFGSRFFLSDGVSKWYVI
jgi:hypothetical protein